MLHRTSLAFARVTAPQGLSSFANECASASSRVYEHVRWMAAMSTSARVRSYVSATSSSSTASASASSGKDDAADARSTTASSTAGPSVSPLQRAPAPTASMRSSFIPGALTDDGLSERASAVLRGAKGSPKKFGAFLRVRRGLKVEDALIQCDLSPKRVAKTVSAVIQSAIGNAVNNQGLDRDRLVIASATVGKGQYLRRVSMHGRGRSGTMHRPRSHVAIEVEENDVVQRRVSICDEEMPWTRRRRLGRIKHAIAEAAGILGK